MNSVLITIAVLAALGCLLAVILYFVSQKFKVYEDPKIAEVEAELPGANCGGCGFPGCHGLAEALAKADDISAIGCPVGGAAVMSKIATILGKEAGSAEPKIAVVRCSASCSTRVKVAEYDGAQSCAIAASHFSSETGCAYGCLGHGDCVRACKFDAIHIDPEKGVVVDEEKCVACGACAKACPKNVIEIRAKGRAIQGKNRRVWVNCVNKDKGAVAMKACKTACIACGKCAKVCKFNAIVVEGNVAYIDYTKCKACGLCLNECPTHALQATFPAPPKPAPKPAAEAPVVPPVQSDVKPADKAE